MNVVPFYVRRLLALIAIGLVHALLLRNGDILVPYATIGFLLPLLRKASNRSLLVCGLIGLFFPEIVRIVWGMSGIPFPRRPDTEGMSHLSSNFVWVRYWYSTAITIWPASIPMFLFGDVSGQATILRGPETTSQVAVWSSYWRFDFGSSRRRGNRILDSSVGEVPSADLDVLPADVAEEFACVGIRRILFLIIIIAVATAKLAAISLASRCGRQDGPNKLPVAIDASHTAVYRIRLVRSGYSGDGTAIGDCGVDHPGSVKQLVVDALQVWTRGIVMALDDLRPGSEDARREECFKSICGVSVSGRVREPWVKQERMIVSPRQRAAASPPESSGLR